MNNEWEIWKEQMGARKKREDELKKYDKLKKTLEWHEFYSKYLNSSLWRDKRKQILLEADHKCQVCGRNDGHLQVHHKRYGNVPGREKRKDLLVVCLECHPKQDRKREKLHREETTENYYISRVEGYARKKYGDNWENHYCFNEVEEEFQLYVFKQQCKEDEIEYYDGFEDVDSMYFYEVCTMLIEGEI